MSPDHFGSLPQLFSFCWMIDCRNNRIRTAHKSHKVDHHHTCVSILGKSCRPVLNVCGLMIQTLNLGHALDLTNYSLYRLHVNRVSDRCVEEIGAWRSIAK